VNTVAANVNTITGQMNEMSQRKKTSVRLSVWLRWYFCYGTRGFLRLCTISCICWTIWSYSAKM